jgi:dUTP pyrophosphatase
MFNLNIRVIDEDMKPYYEKQIEILNKTYSYMNSDSGFDLYLPKDILVKPKESLKIDLKVQCEPRFPGGYYLYPRSSMAKTPLRLKNSVGIVDAMFRGNLIAYIENMSDTETFEAKKGERLFQLCHPTLIAMNVSIVEKVSHTPRGEGGFGSTGK